jgi:tetratricopeptide (TPR) repeat protein
MHPQFVMAAPPKNLPARLFDLYTGDAWNLMPPVQEYVEALGEAGVGTLEQLAYRALLEHGDQKPSESYRLAFEQLLEQTAACGGDVETMLRYFARRCQSGGEHLAMARRCREHGRQRQEIEWLERGAKAHPQDSRVLAALAKAYAREGFIEDALALRWQAYLLIPGEEAYLALRETALIAGQWETWRVRALQTLDGVRMYGTSAMDLRIRLLLAEGENRQALALAQESANVSVSTWEWLLPTAIAHDVPSALRIHHALIQDNIERTHRQAYLVAIKWLRSLQKLHGEHGSPIDFDNHRDQLRQRYRSKRSFIELLDASFPDASR